MQKENEKNAKIQYFRSIGRLIKATCRHIKVLGRPIRGDTWTVTT